jgi:ribonuclease BN (tRNA processing enzyme)
VEEVSVQFLGSGDAFGSGGRFQTCIYVWSDATHLLIDCGASSLVAMKRFGVDPLLVDTILLSHLHGDHFGGVPFFIMDAHLRLTSEKAADRGRTTGAGGQDLRGDGGAVSGLFPTS